MIITNGFEIPFIYLAIGIAIDLSFNSGRAIRGIFHPYADNGIIKDPRIDAITDMIEELDDLYDELKYFEDNSIETEIVKSKIATREKAMNEFIQHKGD